MPNRPRVPNLRAMPGAIAYGSGEQNRPPESRLQRKVKETKAIASENGLDLRHAPLLATFEMPIWGISASPLVEGDLVIIHIGSKPNACLVAFDRKTGDAFARYIAVKLHKWTP